MKLPFIKRGIKNPQRWSFPWFKEKITMPIGFFAVVAFGFGFLFILLTPPFQTPDEVVHFYRAYQISTGNLIVDTHSEKQAGGLLPGSLADTVVLTSTNPIVQFNAGQKYSAVKTKAALQIDENDAHKKVYEFAATASYSPIAYIPQSIGIGVARILDLSPVVMMYGARLGNLLVWILLLSLAIHLLPRRKWAAVVIGLLPMAIFQAGSQSTDVMAVGSAFLFVAYILNLLSKKEPLSVRQVLVVAGMATLALLSKQVMIVLLPLILLIPLKRLHTKKIWAALKLAGLVLVPVTLLLAWTLATKDINTTAAVNNNQNTADQVSFVLQNPHSFINVLWNTHFFTWGDSITRSVIGTFGWMDAPVAEWLSVAGYIMLFLAFTVHTSTLKPKAWLTKNQKIMFFLTVLAYWGIVNAALYALYSPVGFKIIVGLQGRYFLPILILLLPLLYPGWLKSSERFYKTVVTYMPVALLVASALTIGFRYYISNV